jgi:integrase
MASVDKDSKGWRIRFVDHNGQRKQIRPGRGTNKGTAEFIGRHIDHLVIWVASKGILNRPTAEWLGTIGDTMHAKLVKAGLIEKRPADEPVPEVPAKPVIELGTFLSEFRNDGLTASGEKAAELTVIKWRATVDSLIRFFGDDRDITSITHEDAHRFRKWLDERRIKKTKLNPKGIPLAENSKRKHMDCAKVFFNGAKRRGLVAFNPFEHQVSSTRPNRERDYFLTRADTERIIEVCTDAEWRLLVSLWRYAGLRKMEIFQLTWGDVLWDQGKMRVQIPKTKHHEGKDIRYVPLRDIRQYLRETFEAQLPEGASSLPAEEKVITMFSESNSNLDKPFRAILHRAGLIPWPKLFQNLRASCETEWLNEGHPAHVVAAWIGHSVKVQRDSYAQITDGHFDRFNSHPGLTEKSGHTGGPEPSRTDRNRLELSGPPNGPLLSKHEKSSKTLPFSSFSVAAEGLEPPTRGL